MPGIDRHRVVDKSQDELDELTCSICEDIFDEPVVTQCCRQTYCSDCIKQWLFKNNTCPNDRQGLTFEQTTPAPRVFINLLNKMNVKCGNYGNGCEAVLTVEEMRNHMKTCISSNCDSCKSSQNLLADKQMEILSLKNMLKAKEDQVKDLEQKLKSSNPTTAVAQKTAAKDKILEVRQNLEYKVEMETQLNSDQKQFLIDLVKESLLKNETFYTVVKHIHDNISNSKYELNRYYWFVKAGFEANRYTSYSISNKILILTFKGIFVKIQGYLKDLTEAEEIKASSEKFDQYKLVDKSVDETLFRTFLLECNFSLSHHGSFFNIAQHLRGVLEKNTKTKWMVNVFSHSSPVILTCYKKILVDVNKVKIRAYEIRIN